MADLSSNTANCYAAILSFHDPGFHLKIPAFQLGLLAQAVCTLIAVPVFN